MLCTPNRWQTMTWIDDDRVHWRIYASPCLNEWSHDPLSASLCLQMSWILTLPAHQQTQYWLQSYTCSIETEIRHDPTLSLLGTPYIVSMTTARSRCDDKVGSVTDLKRHGLFDIIYYVIFNMTTICRSHSLQDTSVNISSEITDISI